MTTQTKSLDQWLEECPNKLEFYSRFIDVKPTREDCEKALHYALQSLEVN